MAEVWLRQALWSYGPCLKAAVPLPLTPSRRAGRRGGLFCRSAEAAPHAWRHLRDGCELGGGDPVALTAGQGVAHVSAACREPAPQCPPSVAIGGKSRLWLVLHAQGRGTEPLGAALRGCGAATWSRQRSNVSPLRPREGGVDTSPKHGLKGGVAALAKCPSCASLGRAWWLWAACTPRGRGQPTGRPATVSGAWLAASKVADLTAFGRPGAAAAAEQERLYADRASPR